MGRVVTVALNTALAKPITSVGYFLRFNLAGGVQQWCDLGTVTWNGLLFQNVNFDLQGLEQDPDTDFQAALSVDNLDNTIGGMFLNEFMPDVTVDIWQFEASALAAADVVKLCTLAIGGWKVGLDKAIIQLLNRPSFSAWSPRRRVDPSFGFYYALPPGSKISWENQTYVVQEDQGG